MVPIVGKPHRLSFIQHRARMRVCLNFLAISICQRLCWCVGMFDVKITCQKKIHAAANRTAARYQESLNDDKCESSHMISFQTSWERYTNIITKHTHHHHRHQHQHQHQVVYFMCVRPMNEKPKRIKKHTEHRCTDGWMDEWLEQHDQQSKAKQSNERDRNSI